MGSLYPWLQVHVLDLDGNYSGLDRDGVTDLAGASHIIQTVAPIADFDRDPLLALHGSVIRNEMANLEWVGYLSSTGVYGDHGGGWVDEDSTLQCADRKSLARVEAEKEWRSIEYPEGAIGTRVDCFRCGGIYGPGRSVLSSAAKEMPVATPRTAEGAVPKYVNRILVDDIVGAMLTAASSDRLKKNGRAYNLVDDEPATRGEVLKEARRLLGLKEASVRSSPESGIKGSDIKRRISRNTGNKRCLNHRLKEEYGWKLKAPTYREGLQLLVENGCK